MKYTSTRRRANLPSEDELGEGDYSDSGEDNDD